MGVLREFVCFGHGRFDSDEPVCPHGCTVVERVFITAPGLTSNRTKSTDRLLEGIAKDYGLSDMNNHGGTTAARVKPVLQGEARRQQETYNEMLGRRFGVKSIVETDNGTGGWGAVGPGGIYRQGGEIVEKGRGPGAPATTHSLGAPDSNAVGEAREALTPKPVIKIRDPQNLKVA